MTTYTETRSARALAIDRSITAKQVYTNFNQKYENYPNRSDVEGYDTRKTKGGYVSKPKPKEEEKTESEYVPTEEERAKLLPYFYNLNPIEQHKDLLVTKNVIKKKSDIDKWKKNPKYYDVKSIDTQPEELIQERLKVVTKLSGDPEIIIKKFHWRNNEGKYSYIPYTLLDKGTIKIDLSRTSKAEFNKVLAHELGHAYDRNVIGVMKADKNKTYWMSGNVDFGNIKKTNKAKNIMQKISDMREKNSKKVINVISKKISPFNIEKASFNYKTYRLKDEELFADWFSGFITEKNVVKSQSRGFYNIFKKANKPLFKALRQSDYEVTKKYIGGPNVKKFKFNLFK